MKNQKIYQKNLFFVFVGVWLFATPSIASSDHSHGGSENFKPINTSFKFGLLPVRTKNNFRLTSQVGEHALDAIRVTIKGDCPRGRKMEGYLRSFQMCEQGRIIAPSGQTIVTADPEVEKVYGPIDVSRHKNRLVIEVISSPGTEVRGQRDEDHVYCALGVRPTQRKLISLSYADLCQTSKQTDLIM